MSMIHRRSVGVVIILTIVMLSASSYVRAGGPSEESLINTLNKYLNQPKEEHAPHRLNLRAEAPHDENVSMIFEVTHALAELEKSYPKSEKALPIIKRLLTDPDKEVRCKAARVLGALHAEVDEADIKAICAMLKSADTKEVEDGLKALRELNAPSAVPDVLEVLKSSETHNIRDACRTLAILGGKDVIPSIEPLLHHSDSAVRKDAHTAIVALREKS